MKKFFCAQLTRLLAFLLCAFLLTLPSLAKGEEADMLSDAERFEKYTWEELVEALVRKIGGTEKSVALGYCNTVTGEEHFFNPDRDIVTASLYKAPLNMYYSEQCRLGSFSWDDKILDCTYKEAQVYSLTYSNNERSEAMVRKLGGWKGFRAAVAEYVGEDPTDEAYLSHFHHFTAREMTKCMTLLATEPERFPNCIECLLPSAEGKFLEWADVPYEIAQKYGNVPEKKLLHAAGIVYTDDPIVLVVLTDYLGNQQGMFKEYVELMCDYTNYFREKRLAEEAAAAKLAAEEEAKRLAEEKAAAERAAEEEARRLQAEAAARAEREAIQRADAEKKAAEAAASIGRVKALLITAALALCAAFVLLLLASLSKRIPLSPRSVILTFVTFALASGFILYTALDLRLPAEKKSAAPSGSGYRVSTVSPGAAFSTGFSGQKSAALDGLAFVPKTYTLPEKLTVAPKPDPNAFGSTTDPAVIEQLIADASLLLGDDTLLWSRNTVLAPNTVMQYYRDDTIFVLIWKEMIGRRTYTFAEVKLADASQLRRKLADDTYGASIQKFPSQLAQDCNAVCAINGDFYRFQKEGIHIYDRTVCMADTERLDTCYFDSKGNMLFTRAGEINGTEAVTQFAADNDVLFSVSFGPVMIEDGVNTVPQYYWYGQSRDIYARACIAQQGELHYLLTTVYIGDTVTEVADQLIKKGVIRCYAVDGGQSATIVLNGVQVNPSQFDSERTLSDIIYFCTAVPES